MFKNRQKALKNTRCIEFTDKIDFTTPDPNVKKFANDLSEEMKAFYGKSLVEELKKPHPKWVFKPKYKRFPKLCKMFRLGKNEIEWRTLDKLPEKISFRKYAPLNKIEPITEGQPLVLNELEVETYEINVKDYEGE